MTKKSKTIAPAPPVKDDVQSGALPPLKKNEPNADEVSEILTPQTDVFGDEKPSATQAIPAVVEKIQAPKVSSEDVTNEAGATDAAEEQELAFGNFSNKRSMKFDINPDTVKAPSYATDDFREFVEKYQKEKGAKPNILFINTTSLEKLGYRDVAVDLGLHIQESTVYKDDELVLALDL